MKKILVATDFSTAAHNALRYAVQLAEATQAEILLYHVFAPPVLAVTEVPFTILPGSAELKEENTKLLLNEAGYFNGNRKITVKCFTEEGEAVFKIVELAKKEKVDVIIMGMKRVGALTEYLIGSIATSVMKKSTVPVLLIPELYQYKKLDKIVFACDYDVKDTRILLPLRKLVKLFQAQLVVLNISEKLVPVEVEKTETADELEFFLKDTVRSFQFLQDKDVVHGLNKFIRENEVDILVTITHKHNLIETVFGKDHTKQIAFHIHVPIFALPDNHMDVAAYFV